jgi:tRNA(Arg) A34 adenosine deaminase TadA
MSGEVTRHVVSDAGRRCAFGYFLRSLHAALLFSSTAPAVRGQPSRNVTGHPNAQWHQSAEAMKRLAQSWGDQSYGAVLVLGEVIVGEGPSRVVKNGDPAAHAEREAIRDAQRRLQRQSLTGSILYSTSRACRECELAAASAGVSRMYFGEGLQDAGQPRR